MSGFLRKLAVAVCIILVSTYSFNAQTTTDQKLVKGYFDKGVESLKLLNYRDALIYFSRAYSQDPASYYGELSYLYLGKSYALYSYAYRSKQGILASIGFLNQYPFRYKIPRFIHTQREFIADSYLLIQWYENARNIYANLYGETEKSEYLIKLGYATALSGSIENFNDIKSIGKDGIPKDYLDIYYLTLGFYEFNLGRYKNAVEYITRAITISPYLREDPHVLFRLGMSHNKLGDWRRALLHLELALQNDAFGVYEERALFYLALINLETKNFKEAFEKAQRLFAGDRLFYRKLPQLLFASFWFYEDFLKVYRKELGNYREKLLKLGWLNVENIYGELPAIGLYYLSIKSKSLSEEEKEFLRVKNLTLTDFVHENDIFTFERYSKKAQSAFEALDYTKKEDFRYMKDLYTLNRKNFTLLLGTQKNLELFARAMTYRGDSLAFDVFPYLLNDSLYRFLRAQFYLLENRPILALNYLERALSGLKGEDRLEAELLMGYMKEDRTTLESMVEKLTSKRLKPYSTVLYLKIADLSYREGDLRKAIEYYKKVVETADTKDTSYWWAMFRIALAGEKLKSGETIKWVVNRAKEEDNIWSRVIRTLWEG